MNSPNRPVPPPVHEMWETFSRAARGKDPLGTITSLDLLDDEGIKALVGAVRSPPVSISDLPSVPVPAMTGAGEPVTIDFVYPVSDAFRPNRCNVRPAMVLEGETRWPRLRPI